MYFFNYKLYFLIFLVHSTNIFWKTGIYSTLIKLWHVTTKVFMLSAPLRVGVVLRENWASTNLALCEVLRLNTHLHQPQQKLHVNTCLIHTVMVLYFKLTTNQCCVVFHHYKALDVNTINVLAIFVVVSMLLFDVC